MCERTVVVDLTCGRGTDTLFFLELVKDVGLIISIDKQQKALDIREYGKNSVRILVMKQRERR